MCFLIPLIFSFFCQLYVTIEKMTFDYLIVFSTFLILLVSGQGCDIFIYCTFFCTFQNWFNFKMSEAYPKLKETKMYKEKLFL